MKVLGVIVLVVIIIFAIASNGPGVPALNPGNVNTTVPSPVSDGNNTPIAPAASVGGGGLNPAHGQPGHRCDINVGEPLNSKPATQPGQTINSLPALNPAATTAPITPFSVPPVNTGTALNPPHGKPGHRCDIEVGKPLNSKPAQASTATSTVPATTLPTAPLLNAPTASPKINPAHGQPGHRCGIKVGDPL